ELLVDGLEVQVRFYDYGRVYAVHYQSKRENVYGFYYLDPTGHWDYYNEKGQSLRKTILRSPLSFARVSSYFGMRFHPILRVVRPHQGVDYVAPKGTPVSAIADGVITMARYNGGYGKMVEIRHSGGLVSRYGHLSGYGPGIKVGRRIHQGATVGYVGATGLATGPHLHFETRQNGKAVNPLKLIPPRAEPVPRRYFDQFQAVRDGYLHLMGKMTGPITTNSITTHIPIAVSR
ncbi:MAG: M23 family metallopeptidase, partial [bacterium]